MCDFGISAFVASLAIAAASAVASDQAARADAKAQKAYQEAQMRAHNEASTQTANSAIKEQVEQSAAERTQQMQHNAAAAREQQKIQADYLQKKGTAIASSPNAGGASLDALMADYGRAYAVNRDVVQQQLEMQGVAADINVRGYRDRADSHIKAQRRYIPGSVRGPNTLATALGFAGDAIGAYNSATNYGRTPLSSKGASKGK